MIGGESDREWWAYNRPPVGGTLYQGLVVHVDGRFVADLEMGGGVVRALRMARSDAAGGAGWRDLTGKLVFLGTGGAVALRRAAGRARWLPGHHGWRAGCESGSRRRACRAGRGMVHGTA